jgi:hypothetical protein
MIELRPAIERITGLATAVVDDRLDSPTPCPDARLGDLIDHVGSLALSFTAAAQKEAPAPGRHRRRTPPTSNPGGGTGSPVISRSWGAPGRSHRPTTA